MWLAKDPGGSYVLIMYQGIQPGFDAVSDSCWKVEDWSLWPTTSLKGEELF